MFHDVRGQGPDLVLLHGWAMHAGIFAPLVARLAPHFTLHLVDLPGHGRSARAGLPLRLADAAGAVAAVVPPRALWLGWSLGGLVALQRAAAAPAAVRGLAMLAASPRFVRAEDWTAGMDAAVFHTFARELGRDYRGTLDRFLMLEAQGSNHVREELRLLRGEVFAHGEPSADVLRDGLGLLEDSDLRAALPALAMPSLWIAGRRDRLVSPAAMRAAADVALRSRFVQVESGGHAPFLTHADDVAEALLAFAADCPP
ncbi:MAG TPA: pimeloyl-ACP methyl ester esterase BioH [Arenimonas sp.]|uniref:pimeloyl-ACP methyl ester esterase BioH n=1 Tax=Arenimonas sp. TaxID=1872635 RepID=UPI002D7EA908|nr:pimeloyl-ACP methyl ester esterase BioH [Arenimonas sp.]HEU0153446.1 pimeloyl-ACP methyl ester esterase BioH [Arenimonas sp.]